MSQKKNILIIDDESSIRENIGEYLREFNFQTLLAQNGVEGVQIAIEHKPDLILCDIDMPGMNGHEVLRQIQEFSELSVIPFIFLTAKSSTAELREGMQMGADDYITKPFKLSDILRSVNRRIEKSERIKKLSEEKLMALAETNLVGIFFYQRNGFSYTNTKFQQLSGYTPSELTQLPIKEIIAGNHDNINIEKLETCLNGITNSLSLSTQIKDKNKVLKSAEISVNHIKLNNVNTLIGLIQSDQTNTNNITRLNHAYDQIIKQLKKENKADLADELEKMNNGTEIGFNDPSDTQEQLIAISKREREILTLISRGLTNLEIAKKLEISDRTVENHRANLLSKTKSKNTAQLVSFGIRHLEIKE